MAAAVFAVAATVGAEAIGVAMGGTFIGWGALAAKAAFSAGLALVSESLNSPAQQPQAQAPIAAEISARKQLIRASAGPRRAIYGAVGRVSGNLLYVANGTDTDYVHFVIALADHSCQAINDSYLGDEKVGDLDGGGNVTTGRFAGHVRIKKYLGSLTQTMDAELAAECPEWGAKDRPGKGITYVYLRLKRSRDVFPQGVPTPRFDVQGKNDILDVRTGTRGYTQNAALCSLDYVLWDRGFGSALDEVVQADWIAAANVCDEDVAVPGGGTQKRYAINGSFTTDRKIVNVLDEMRQAMAGGVNYTMGLWYAYAGAASAPVMDISERDLRGPYRVRPRVTADTVYNGVKGTYTETSLWTETDFPPVKSATYLAQDNGRQKFKEVRLAFETDPYRAQRLAKTDLERHRQEKVVELPMRIKGLGLRPGNVVRLSLKKMGYVNKLFRVVRWNFNLFGGPDLVLEGYEDAIYTWSSLDAVVVGATPDTTLPNPCIIATPAMPTLSSGTPELMELGDGTVISRMRVAWPNPTDAYVRRAEVRYRVAGDTEWQAGPPVPDASTGFVHLNPVIDGAGYEVQLRFENSLGVRSAWSDTSIHLVVGKREKPADVPWFLINGNDLTWGTVAGADIAGYRLRWQPDNLLSWGDANPLLIDDGLVLASPYTMIARPAGPVTLLIKAIDDSGNESVKPAAIVTDLGDPLVLNILASRDERALGWPGTLSGGAVDGVSGDILASHDASPAMWSNDAAAMWTHDWEPMWAPATYAALEYIVVLPQLVATDVGGGITVVADVVGSPWSLEYRRIGAEPMWTNDAAPMWTGDADAMWSPAEAWKPWPGRVVAETVAYEFRIRCAAGDVQGRIAALYVNIDVPDVTERLDDVVIAAGGTRLPITKSYRVIKNVGLTLQADGGTARGTRLEDKNATLGPLVICLDGAGVSVAGLVDVNQIQGY